MNINAQSWAHLSICEESIRVAGFRKSFFSWLRYSNKYFPIYTVIQHVVTQETSDVNILVIPQQMIFLIKLDYLYLIIPCTPLNSEIICSDFSFDSNK